MTRTAALAVFVALIAGCSPSDHEDVVIEEIDGVTYVRNGARVDTTGFPYRFVLEQTFGAEEEPQEAILASISDMVVDQRGNVYVLDDGERVVAFSREGNLLWVVGRSGEGPEELTRSRNLTLLGDSILYVSEQFGTAVEIWTVDGTYRGSQKLPEEIDQGAQHAGYVDGKLIVATPVQDRIGVVIWVVDTQGTTISDSVAHVQPLGRESEVTVSVSSTVNAHGGTIHVGSVTKDYAFWTFDRTGTMLRKVTRQVDYLPGPASALMGAARVTYGMSNLSVLPALNSGEQLVLVTWPEVANVQEWVNAYVRGEVLPSTSYYSLDLFDDEGRYLASNQWEIENSRFGSPHTVGPDGMLYSRSSTPFPQVRRYRIEPY